MPQSIHTLAIIGVGMIGGSLARALKQASPDLHIVGYGRNAGNLQQALSLGVIDRIGADIADTVAAADIVVLCVPLGAIADSFQAMAAHLQPHAVVTDVGSAKGSVVTAARQYLGESIARFVPGHPIAGSEQSGVAAARADLFVRRRVILTPLDDTATDALQTVRAMWETAGAGLAEMPVVLHDEVLAATSHLPHLLAYSLVDALASMDGHDDIFHYAAGGFADFTRIASSDPAMWRDICLSNRDAIVPVLEGFRADLDTLAAAIREGDGQALFDLFTRAKAARDAYVKGLS